MDKIKKLTCPCCNNHAEFRLRKGNTNYFQCSNCKTLFSLPLDNDNMVGGGNEIQRNEVQNAERMQRFEKLLHRKPSGIKILDFGCGHGYLVSDLKKARFDATGYDAYNEEFNKLPLRDTYTICSMVEVIEHLSHPFVELDCVYRSLVKGGILYVETSFVDIAQEEGIPLEDFFYINPDVGHSTIFSYHGLDVLMLRKGFDIFEKINRNVHIYIKKQA